MSTSHDGYSLQDDPRLSQAILETAQEPLLVLDVELKVCRANPAFCTLFRTSLDETTGRHLFDLGNRQWDIPELRSLLHAVLSEDEKVEGYRIEHNLPTIGPRVMVLNARRIAGTEAQPDLILLTITDITELERARFELEGQKEFNEKIVDSIREALLVLGWDLRVRHANQPFYDIFKVTPAETEGRLVYEIGNGQWNIPELRRLLEDILPNQSSFNDFEVEHEFDGVGRRIMLLNARRLDHLNLVLLAIEDITEREHGYRRQRILARELSHRVKNVLALVDAMASQTATKAKSVDDFLASFHGRIRALARSHGQWLASEWSAADLRQLVRETLEGCSIDSERVSIVGEPVPVAEGQTMGLNLILHELCTNAVKHGALSVSSGRVEVIWSTEKTEGSKQVRLLWSESGGPDVRPPKRKGFGLQLIKRLIPHELNGEAYVRYETGGFQCELVFPLEQP